MCLKGRREKQTFKKKQEAVAFWKADLKNASQYGKDLLSKKKKRKKPKWSQVGQKTGRGRLETAEDSAVQQNPNSDKAGLKTLQLLRVYERGELVFVWPSLCL